MSAPTGEGADAWAAALVSLEGPSILRETQELRARLASLDARSDAARRRAVELSERFAADLADGKLAAAPRLEHTAEQLGRPPVRSPGRELGLASVAITALLTEAWAIALPALSATGRSPPTVTGALRPETIEAVLTCAFALGISVGLLALALLTLRAAEAFVREATAAARRRVHVTALLVGILGAAGAVAAATLPAPRSGLPPPSHAFLLLSISAGTALLLRGARRERDERAAEAAAALAWDRERARALGERAQRLEELVWAEAAMREVDGLRQRTSTRLDQLVRRSTAAARLVARAEELAQFGSPPARAEPPRRPRARSLRVRAPGHGPRRHRPAPGAVEPAGRTPRGGRGRRSRHAVGPAGGVRCHPTPIHLITHPAAKLTAVSTRSTLGPSEKGPNPCAWSSPAS